MNGVWVNEPNFQNKPSKFKQHLLIGAVLGISLLLTNCTASNQKAESGVPPTIPLNTSVAATLPPTWTIVPSQTPSPTSTTTPTATVTQTPTITPTLAAETICENFKLVSVPDDGVSIPYVGFIAFSWEGSPPDSVVVLSIVRTQDSSEILIQYPPEAQRNAYFEFYYLPTWGMYRWTLSLVIEPYGELCASSGSFFREAWWNQPIANPLAPPFIFRVNDDNQ